MKKVFLLFIFYSVVCTGGDHGGQEHHAGFDPVGGSRDKKPEIKNTPGVDDPAVYSKKQSALIKQGAVFKVKKPYLPYRVIGVKCHEGEHCTSQPAPYAGFKTKSNIPLNDERQSRIRPNVISKAVLRIKLEACKADNASPLSNPEEQCRPTTANITGSGTRRIIKYRLRDINMQYRGYFLPKNHHRALCWFSRKNER